MNPKVNSLTNVYPIKISKNVKDSLFAAPSQADSAMAMKKADSFISQQQTQPNINLNDLLVQCRRLLYSVYHDEMQWNPGPGTPSGFQLDHENKQFCDRFDFNAIWHVVAYPEDDSANNLQRKHVVVGCCRSLPGRLINEFDLTGYSQKCSPNFLEWIERQGVHNVTEMQRMAIRSDYRKYFLLGHLALGATLVDLDVANKTLYNPQNGHLFISTGIPSAVKTVLKLGLKIEGYIEYDKSSGKVPLFKGSSKDIYLGLSMISDTHKIDQISTN